MFSGVENSALAAGGGGGDGGTQEESNVYSRDLARAEGPLRETVGEEEEESRMSYLGNERGIWSWLASDLNPWNLEFTMPLGEPL